MKDTELKYPKLPRPTTVDVISIELAIGIPWTVGGVSISIPPVAVREAVIRLLKESSP
jgi:hypothetical protein